MKTDFSALTQFLTSNPEKYRTEIARMRRESPKDFDAYVVRLRAELAAANEAEDRPMTADETEAMIENTCHALHWSRSRVISEGVLRLRHAALYSEEPFRPLTPPERVTERRGMYLRRHSSLEAIVLGEVRAARGARSVARASGRRPIDPRRDEEPTDPRRDPSEPTDELAPKSHAASTRRLSK